MPIEACDNDGNPARGLPSQPSRRFKNPPEAGHGRWTATPEIAAAQVEVTDPRVAKIIVAWKPMVFVTIGANPYTNFHSKPTLEAMSMTGVTFAELDQGMPEENIRVIANAGTRRIMQEIVEDMGPQGKVRTGLFRLLTEIGEQVRKGHE